MAFTRQSAAKLCSETEFALFSASFPDQSKNFTKAQLTGKLQRAKKLRQKYQDLYKRQRLAARARTGSKGGRSGDANLRTAQKQQLFAEAVARLQARLDLIHAAEERERLRAAKAAADAARRAVPAPRPAKKKSSAAKTSAAKTFQSIEARAAQRARQTKRPGAKASRAHSAAQTRRNQAKRDRR